ncbi:hypothetical protein [Erythrobacter dokdonensis]|uniref:Secreted protein n=1 Tax=Erythrobacter dokdonensis DSW-74 TaxID=1300349 RepID=A0A1A7BCI2_9SPHN|nr:hypothetical protein [Erythrobacter dokdonensis]OBV10209.1 hypothetical protein I603_2171 [Erythrobacter dokdonensis DSW-74]
MSGRSAVLLWTVLASAAVFGTLPAVNAQEAQGSRVETVQIGDEIKRRAEDEATGKAYLGPAPAAPTARERRLDIAGEQVTDTGAERETMQISTGGRNSSSMSQLSRAELEARLAQLTPSERRVLFQAIEGTDICDNPPDIDAIRALCRNRIETRSGEFAERSSQPVSAEERLLRGGVDENGVPNVERVIERLARTKAAPDDFDNQAIASVALAPPPPASGPEEEAEPLSGLPPGTEGVINAIINQLGGGGAGGP